MKQSFFAGEQGFLQVNKVFAGEQGEAGAAAALHGFLPHLQLWTETPSLASHVSHNL